MIWSGQPDAGEELNSCPQPSVNSNCARPARQHCANGRKPGQPCSSAAGGPAGTGGKDSDWDVAIVLSGDNPERARPATNPEEFPHAAALFDLDPVDCWTLTEGYLNRRATDLGSLPYAVCRDGRLLAGQLRIPDKKKIREEATLNPEDWNSRMTAVLTQLNLAMVTNSKRCWQLRPGA